MSAPHNSNYFIISVVFHVAVVIILALGFDFTAPLAVIENTNKNDVISAVVLGDTAKSKILPQKPTPEPVQQVAKPESKPTPPPPPPPKLVSKALQEAIQKDVIALKITEKKKLAEKKAEEEKKQRDLFAKDLLADIKKQTNKHKEIKQKQLKSQFQKLLREQAEQSLRQQLLNEEIKLQGTQNRQAQGEVNKYKALILQAISEHWLVPPQADKKLSCELMIRLAPGGVVLDVQITRSSGDPALDSSARAAVMKSSPLPVPTDTEAFEPFREFVLKVKPENVLAATDMSNG